MSKTEKTAVLPQKLDEQHLAGLGLGTIAYIRPVRAGDIVQHVPEAGELEPDTELFALHAASGQPIMLATDRAMAVSQAKENNLTAVSVH